MVGEVFHNVMKSITIEIETSLSIGASYSSVPVPTGNSTQYPYSSPFHPL